MAKIKKADGSFYTDAELRALRFSEMTDEVAEQIIASTFDNPADPGHQVDVPFLYTDTRKVNRQVLEVLEGIVTSNWGFIDKSAYRFLVAGLQYLQAINSDANIARAAAKEPVKAPATVHPFFSLGQKKNAQAGAAADQTQITGQQRSQAA